MKIVYRNKLLDILRFMWCNHTRSPLIMGSILIVSLWIGYSSLPKSITGLAAVLTFIIMTLIIAIFIFTIGFLFSALAMISKRNKTFFTEHIVTLHDDHFIEETEYNKSEYKWSAVQKLRRNNSFIFLYVAKFAAHIIPKRDFESIDKWDDFYDFCKKQYEAEITR